MRISAQLTYAAGTDPVFAMLVDPAFSERTCRANHALSHDVRVDSVQDGSTTITVHRTMPTDRIPDFLRSFIGETLPVTETRDWGPPRADGTRSGTLVVAIEGAPVRLRAMLRLASDGRTGAVQTIDGDLKAGVPLIGGKIEKAVEPAILAAIAVEESTATAWLSGH